MKTKIILFISFCALLLFAGCSRSENQWKNAQKENTVATYQDYIREYPDGKHIKEARNQIEKLLWNAAFSERNEQKLLACISKYPLSNNIARAEEAIWSIKWPVVSIDKADNVTIFSNGKGIRRGAMTFSLGKGGSFGQLGPGKAAGPVKVWIWRNFTSSEKAMADEIGLRSGYAYLVPENGGISGLKLIQKVNLSLSDDAIYALFGVK